MAVQAGFVQRQQQTVTMSPEHIVGKAILKMSLQELSQYIAQQLAENPALVMDEESVCPMCGSPLAGDYCPSCGSEKYEYQEIDDGDDEWKDLPGTPSVETFDEEYEPFDGVAAPSSLQDSLKEQIALACDYEEREIAEYIIDTLDEDGYLREPLIEIAGNFAKSVPQIEEVLCIVQSLDPPGIGARDLRECMLLQIERLDEDSDARMNAEIILRKHWESFEKLKLDRIAQASGIDAEDVSDAVRYMRDNLNPRPADAYSVSWERLAPRRTSRTRPDVILQQSGTSLSAKVTEPTTSKVAVEELYAGIYAEMAHGKNGRSSEESEHIKEYVTKANSLIEALEFRKSTLRKVMDDLLETQTDFFTKGPSALKPMTRKELAARIGVHESTVCRATQNKSIRLPSGEATTFDVLFDSALPVKEMVRNLCAQKLSDSQIAAKLTEAGIKIARRTVAKYRDQLRVLSCEYRVA